MNHEHGREVEIEQLANEAKKNIWDLKTAVIEVGDKKINSGTAVGYWNVFNIQERKQCKY